MYYILWDYGSDGHCFHSKDGKDLFKYKSINEAVKAAVDFRSSSPFKIVTIIDWEANIKSND